MVIIKKQLQTYSTKVLDHLGLIAGMCNELNIAKIIDAHLPNDSPDKILSTGNAIVGLILNGLGFVNKRLYLVSRFFENKPVSKLLNVSYLESSHFNDDALGRALDAVYEFGVSKLYSIISHHVIKHLQATHGLNTESGQMDNTTFHLHGAAKNLELPEGQHLEIVRGYSKDHRPDLVQVGLQLIVETQSRIPLLMKVLSGNEEEGKSYGAAIKNHAKQLQNDYGLRLIVVDSKLYNQDNILLLKEQVGLNWLTRVPNGLLIVKQLIASIDKSSLQPLKGHENYRYEVVYTDYGSEIQRWLVLHSDEKYERDLKGLHKKLTKQTKEATKACKQLFKLPFETEEKALTAADKLSKGLKINNLGNISIISKNHYDSVGKPKKGQIPNRITYHIQADLSSDLDKYELEKGKIGYFILATNELDDEQITPEKLLSHYKNQAVVERSFRFLKDPNIVASSLFVQKTERMMAIMMVMTLCLLVYSALEYVTRTTLRKENLTFPNQLGKPIQNPTMKWIFECFEGVHILYTPDNEQIILNMKEHQKFILKLLGKNYLQFYT